MNGALADAYELGHLSDAQPAVRLRGRGGGPGAGDALGYELIEPGVDRRSEGGGQGRGELGFINTGWCTQLVRMSLLAADSPPATSRAARRTGRAFASSGARTRHTPWHTERS
jgi:hypothetical protein